MLKFILGLLAAISLTACAGGSSPAVSNMPYPLPPQSGGGLSLPDTIVFSQKDRRWAAERMGGSGASMESEGCLVTAAAMAMTNLGYKISPGELNARLKQEGGYTKSGQLIWAGIGRVSGGVAAARYHNSVSQEIIASCMRDGFYPLARFKLPSGRTHWSMIVRHSAQGYHMRDPLHLSSKPLIFPKGISGFEAIRCVGRA